MNVWAIVPVKPLARAKSRLADELSPDERELLATNMLMRTVGLLLPLLDGVLVISRDSKALSMVRDLGAQTVQESGAPELNNAIFRATQVLKAARRADAVLIVPADMPMLSPADIDEVVSLGQYYQSVVIAPDRHEVGTNLLLVRPPGLIEYAYGAASFADHQALAMAVKAHLHIHYSERVGLDIDTPDDLAYYRELAKRLGEPVIDPVGAADNLSPRDTGEWAFPELT